MVSPLAVTNVEPSFGTNPNNEAFLGVEQYQNRLPLGCFLIVIDLGTHLIGALSPVSGGVCLNVTISPREI